MNRSNFSSVKLRNFLYANKVYSLVLESGQHIKELEDKYFIQLNLNATDKKYKVGEDIIMPYGLNSNEVYLNNSKIILKYLEYYKNLYYNGNRNEEVIWLTAILAKSFTELYKILSNALKGEELKEFMERMERISMDGLKNFSIHEWEKEKLDALVERETKRYAKEEGLAEGREQGLKQGREEGLKEKQLEIAQNLLKNKVSIDIIVNSTGLTKEEIEKLSNN